MRGFSSLAILAMAICFGALVAACVSSGTPFSSCSCGVTDEVSPATLRITKSSRPSPPHRSDGARPELIDAEVDVTPGRVIIRTRDGLIVFAKVERSRGRARTTDR